MILCDKSPTKWKFDGDTYVCGYACTEDHPESQDLLSLFRAVRGFEQFRNVVVSLRGSFAVVLHRGPETYAAVDVARSIPVFLSVDGGYVSSSATALVDRMGLGSCDIDDTSVAEMLLAGFVSGNRTAYRSIAQLSPGQLMRVADDEVQIESYYRHSHQNRAYDSDEEPIARLSQVTNVAFDRLLASLHNRPVLLPLSGGYDSRFIAAMLRKKGYDRVVCYTYGNQDRYEVRVAEQVARRLGYPWHCVEYTREMWESLFDLAPVVEYATLSTNECTIPHFQDIGALVALEEKGLVPPDSVVVPGFCGDLPAGSFTATSGARDHYSMSDVLNHILTKFYLFVCVLPAVRQAVVQRIEDDLRKMGCSATDSLTYEEFVSVTEEWLTCHGRPSRWVVNSNRVYEQFGLEWRIPFWDRDYLDFWYTLSSEFRASSRLYKRFLFEGIFQEYDIAYRKPEYTAISDIRGFRGRVIDQLYRLITRLTYATGIDAWNYRDVNNYTHAALVLYKDIHNKWVFRHDRVSFHQMNAIWWTERHYGPETVARLCDGRRVHL